MGGCSVLGCKSRTESKAIGEVTFHSFPKDKHIEKLWIDATGQQNWLPTKYSKICSIHFNEDTINVVNKNKRIKPEAIPVKHINRTTSPYLTFASQIKTVSKHFETNASTAKATTRIHKTSDDENVLPSANKQKSVENPKFFHMQNIRPTVPTKEVNVSNSDSRNKIVTKPLYITNEDTLNKMAPKSNAERQKKYRENLKLNKIKYEKVTGKHREYMKLKRRLIAEMAENEKQQRRRQWRAANKARKLKKKSCGEKKDIEKEKDEVHNELKLREQWLKAARRHEVPSPKSVNRCCKDHYDKENDTYRKLVKVQTCRSFPKDLALRNAWVSVCGRQDWTPKNNTRVCSKHFEKQCFRETLKLTLLRHGSVPNLFVHGKFGSDQVMNKKTMIECRACLQKIDNEICQELFLPWNTPWDLSSALVADDLSRIANIKISESDKHSKVICSDCTKRLAGACLFVMMVQKSDSKLQKQLDNTAYVDSVTEPVTSSWPKPIQLNKNLNGGIDNNTEIEIKQEVLSEDENDSNSIDLDWEPTMDIKIEPEEIVAPVHSDIQVNDAIFQNGFSIRYEEEYLDNIIKQEPSSDDEQEMVPDLPLDCMLCTKAFNSVTGLKAHVISQHSYGTVKRKADECSLPVVKKEINEFVCATCRESFGTRTDLMVHETCHGKHACYVCDAKFNTFRQLSRHGARCRPINVAATNRKRPPSRLQHSPQTGNISPTEEQNNEPLQKQPRSSTSTDEVNAGLVETQSNNGPSNEKANDKLVESQSNKEPSNVEIKPIERQSDVFSNEAVKVKPVQEQSKNEPSTEDRKIDILQEPHISTQYKKETEGQSTSAQETVTCNSLKNLSIILQEFETDITEMTENSSPQLLFLPMASSPYSLDNLEKNSNEQEFLELNNLTAENTLSEFSLEQESEPQYYSTNIPDEKNSDSPRNIVTNTDEINEMKIHLAINPLNEEDSVLLDTKMDIEDAETETSEL